MNDFLKQIEAYSNDKLERIMPQMQVQNIQMNNQLSQQIKVAEHVKNMIDRSMSHSSKNLNKANSSTKAYSDMHGEED